MVAKPTITSILELNLKKGLLMASLNVNGLKSHFDEIKALVKSMGIDILALNETKLDHLFEQQITEVIGTMVFLSFRLSCDCPSLVC